MNFNYIRRIVRYSGGRICDSNNLLDTVAVYCTVETSPASCYCCNNTRTVPFQPAVAAPLPHQLLQPLQLGVMAPPLDQIEPRHPNPKKQTKRVACHVYQHLHRHHLQDNRHHNIQAKNINVQSITMI